MNNENIDKLIESINTNKFSYRSPLHCIGAHVATLRGSHAFSDPLGQISAYIGCTRKQADDLYWANGQNIPTATAEDAVEALEALRD